MSSSFFPAHLSCSFCLQTGSQKLGVFQRTAYKVNATQVFANLQKNALFLRVFANLLKKDKLVQTSVIGRRTDSPIRPTLTFRKF